MVRSHLSCECDTPIKVTKSSVSINYLLCAYENTGDSLEEAMHPTLPVPSFMERSGSVNSYEGWPGIKFCLEILTEIYIYIFTDATHWHKQAKRIIKTKIRQHPIEQKAKNVIFFLGDGMSIPTVTSARIFKGQLENLTYGEEAALSFDQFPFTGVSKVCFLCQTFLNCVWF